ncbi:MAG: DUF1552 domain-containing protein [Archangiaceae bacterium]|nr:DUF1552 domain-containing protein [Archangiaceae bacterium]
MLRGAGRIAIALPFLQAMTAFGQTGAPRKKRLVLWETSGGTVFSKWRPTGTGTGFTPSPILAPLDSAANPANSKNDLIVLDGVNMESSFSGPSVGAHQAGLSHLWIGRECVSISGANGYWGGGQSVDQYIANQVSVDSMGNPLTRFKSLEAMVGAEQDATYLCRMIYSGAGKPVTPENDPTAFFNRVFSGVRPGGADAGVDPAMWQRKSILDTAMADYTALKARLGPEDRARLDQHLTAIRDIESRLSLGNTGGGNPACAPSAPGLTGDPNANANFPQVGTLMMDLIVMALACDLTRVASLQWSHSVSRTVHTWAASGITRGHHDMSHDADTNADTQSKLTAINTWFSAQLAYFIRKLKAIDEGGNSLFSNTVTCWGNELSIGNIHGRRPIPFVLAGSCAGYFRTGRSMVLSGVPHNNLLVSLCNAMGLPDTRFGNPSFCTGPIAGLT